MPIQKLNSEPGTPASVVVGTSGSALERRGEPTASASNIPFKGSAEAVTEVIAGRVDYYFSPVAPVIGQIKSTSTLESEEIGVTPAKSPTVSNDSLAKVEGLTVCEDEWIMRV